MWTFFLFVDTDFQTPLSSFNAAAEVVPRLNGINGNCNGYLKCRVDCVGGMLEESLTLCRWQAGGVTTTICLDVQDVTLPVRKKGFTENRTSTPEVCSSVVFGFLSLYPFINVLGNSKGMHCYRKVIGKSDLTFKIKRSFFQAFNIAAWMHYIDAN